MSALVELTDVTKVYPSAGAKPVRALDGVSFEVAQGEWLAMMGPSGSGKTTLLNLLGCLDTATSGSVRIGGTDTATLSRGELARFRAETVGFIFQQFHLVPHLTALENVMLAQYFHSTEDQDEARQALEQVGLSHRMDHLPSKLSGGEQQRVAIARALINDPKMILADEPTGNLDAENQRGVLNILSELHAKGRTIVMVTHDEHVGRAADRRIDLGHGRIVESTVFSSEENMHFDELLEGMWAEREKTGGDAFHAECTQFTAAQQRRLVNTMTRIGLICCDDAGLHFTEAGEIRARSVIRRHRLAERLFMDVLSIRDAGTVESNACTFEHILSPEVTDRICTFLGHPETCPHGGPIPRGECCNRHAKLRKLIEIKAY